MKTSISTSTWVAQRCDPDRRRASIKKLRVTSPDTGEERLGLYRRGLEPVPVAAYSDLIDVDCVQHVRAKSPYTRRRVISGSASYPARAHHKSLHGLCDLLLLCFQLRRGDVHLSPGVDQEAQGFEWLP